MTPFWWMIIIALALVAFVMFLWTLRPDEEDSDRDRRGVKPSRSGDSRDDELPSRSGDGAHPSRRGLVSTDLPEFMDTLRKSNPVQRYFATEREVSIADQGRRKVEADTGLMKAQAEQVETYVDKSNQIRNLEGEAKLQPLRHEEERAKILANTDEHKLRGTKARVESRTLRNPPSPPELPSPPKRKSALKKAEEDLESHLAKGMARLQAAERVREKFAKKHGGNADLMADLDDLITGWTEEASME